MSERIIATAKTDGNPAASPLNVERQCVPNVHIRRPVEKLETGGWAPDIPSREEKPARIWPSVQLVNFMGGRRIDRDSRSIQ
jgi:hypothetical protein